MKRIITVAMCLVMAVAVTQVSAQKNDRKEKKNARSEQTRPERSHEEMAKHMADRMKERLDLTDAQYAKVLELNKDHMKGRENRKPMSREEMDKMTEEQKTARREEMKKMREQYDAKLKTILTDEQYAKYEEQRKDAPGGRRPGGHGHGNGQHMGRQAQAGAPQ